MSTIDRLRDVTEFKMTEAGKRFVLNRLIPAILREAGCGFGMDDWQVRKYRPGEVVSFDEVERPVPQCGTVACIGGTIAWLGGRTNHDSWFKACDDIGLDYSLAGGLFYHWTPASTERYRWPRKFAVWYALAKTPLDKARIAAGLLTEVVRTDGACLSTAWRAQTGYDSVVVERTMRHVVAHANTGWEVPDDAQRCRGLVEHDRGADAPPELFDLV